MRIHFISIGGAVMHNLAIALKKAGHQLTGSDDEIYDPARSRLEKEGLLPKKEGWFESNIQPDIDLIILGMHARGDNPELIKAGELGLQIMSFPEYIYRHSKNKIRVMVGGSHGKTTTTSMIMHALKACEVEFDYLVGAYLDGFENMVSLSDAPIVVIEGDEYLSSAIDRRPKFFHYRPQISILTGIAWDHMNVFPTSDFYFEQFVGFLQTIPDDGLVFWYGEDDQLKRLTDEYDGSAQLISYKKIPHKKSPDLWALISSEGKEYPVNLFGEHNMANFQAALLVCRELGLSELQFLEAMKSFEGAKKRLQLIEKFNGRYFYQDFAHAPSKVKATVESFRQRFTSEHICAVVELHTYSSLNQEFLPQYKGALDEADVAIVFFSPHTLKMKRMPPLNKDIIRKQFDREDIIAVNNAEELREILIEVNRSDTNYLMMSSGTFGGLDLSKMSGELLH
nr:hypothetical protein [Saprospiraceae bacterium]